MAGLGSIAWTYAVYFIISLHIIVIQSVESQEGKEGPTEETHPLVLTTVGLIRGLQEENYAMFLGIPYAKVDKDLPFEFPKPYPKFENIFEANDDTAICPQLDDGTPIGTLDCLNLNIYVPKSSSEKLLPVLIWIHGGGEFETGSGRKDNYGPQFLVRHGMILVTFNYRLGIYGFMCFMRTEVGNQGLQDQLLAFRWIKENVEAFGGDPNQMTLGGEGSGSVCVDLHLHSPQARMFSKFILQGQTALSPNYTKDVRTTSDAVLKSVLKQMLLYPNQTKKLTANSLTSFSRNESFISLYEQNPMYVLKAVGELGFKFGLCISADRKFFLKDPRSEQWQSQGTSKPILIGSNEDALLHNMYAGDDMRKMASVFDNTIRDIMNPVSMGDFAKRFRNFYIGDRKIDNDVKREVIDFQSDYNIWYPIERSIENYDRMGAKVYRYVFSYVGERNYMKYLLKLTSGGATSADELGYLFDMKIFDRNPNPQDQLMIDRITTLWANFVKHGNPTNDGDSELLPVSWPPVTKHINKMPYLVLNSEISIEERPFKKRMAFWKMFNEYLNFIKLKGKTKKSLKRMHPSPSSTPRFSFTELLEYSYY